MRNLWLALVVVVVVALMPSRSSAQAAAGSAEEASDSEVIVTARKREEALQDVPLTVNVIDASSLPASSGNDFGAAFQRSPNTGFIGTGFPGNNLISIRGIGGLATFGPFDASVSVTLDEVPVPIRSFDTLLLDAARVELLKGPQGTLYGRSSLNGALNIVSRPLTDTWAVDGRVEGGERGYLVVSGSAGGAAIPDRLWVRTAVKFTNFNGDIPNLLTSDKSNSADIFAGRVTARVAINDTSSLTVAYQADREDRQVPSALLRSDPQFPLGGEDVLSGGGRDTDRLTFRLDRDLGGVDLAILGGFEQSEVRNSFDLTDSILAPAAFGVPAAFLNNPSNDKSRTNTDEESMSLEVRLQSDRDGALGWTLGASYLKLTLDRNLSRRSIIPSFNVDEIQSNRNATFGAFGDLAYQVSERIELGAGLRMARDEIDYDGETRFFGPLAPQAPFLDADEVADTYATGHLSAVVDFGSASLFARAARGYGSAGFGEYAANGLSRQPIRPFQSSANNAFELGLRTARRWGRASITAFYNDVSDGQLYSFDPTTFANVAENLDFESYGVEADAQVKIAPWLTIEGSLGLQRARLSAVPAISLSGAREGGRVPNSPEFTGRLALSGGRDEIERQRPFFYAASVTRLGDRAADAANSFELEAATIIEARFGIHIGGAELYAFGTDLTDERPQLYGQNFGSIATPLPAVNIGRGRVIGLGISASF